MSVDILQLTSAISSSMGQGYFAQWFLRHFQVRSLGSSKDASRNMAACMSRASRLVTYSTSACVTGWPWLTLTERSPAPFLVHVLCTRNVQSTRSAGRRECSVPVVRVVLPTCHQVRYARVFYRQSHLSTYLTFGTGPEYATPLPSEVDLKLRTMKSRNFSYVSRLTLRR